MTRISNINSLIVPSSSTQCVARKHLSFCLFEWKTKPPFIFSLSSVSSSCNSDWNCGHKHHPSCLCFSSQLWDLLASSPLPLLTKLGSLNPELRFRGRDRPALDSPHFMWPRGYCSLYHTAKEINLVRKCSISFHGLSSYNFKFLILLSQRSRLNHVYLWNYFRSAPTFHTAVQWFVAVHTVLSTLLSLPKKTVFIWYSKYFSLIL